MSTVRSRANFRRLTKKLIIKRIKLKAIKNCGKWHSFAKRIADVKLKNNRFIHYYTPLEKWEMILSHIVVKVKKQNKAGWYEGLMAFKNKKNLGNRVA